MRDTYFSSLLCQWALPSSLILTIAAYCVYNAWFHPLARYPGPFFAKFTILRGTYHAWKGDVHLDTLRCHRTYGPVFRYAPDRLVFSSPDAIRDIYSVGSNVTKDPTYAALGHDKLNLVTLVDKSEHSKRRRLVAGSFSLANIKKFEPSILVYVERFITALSPSGLTVEYPERWGPAVDISDWCSYLTFDTMTDFVFGLKYDLLRDQRWRHVVHDIEVTNVRLYVLMHLRMLYLGRLDKWLFPAATRGAQGFLGFVNRLLADYPRRGETKHVDAFKHFTGDKNGSPAMIPKQVYSEAVMFVTAAQDTTSISLRAILFYLSRNPHAYTKLALEIRTAFAIDEPVTMDDKLKSCVYLNACIMESMRLSPAITGATMFRHTSRGGQTVDGEHIPAGYNVSAGIYTVHHNEDIFPHPFEFMPERWILDENTTQEQLDLRLKMWVPFSVGARACIGKAFTQTLFSITVASVMRKYDFRVADGPEGASGGGHPCGGMGRTNPGEYQLWDYIVSTGEGPVLQFKRCG
ncbi:cytochrome P450 [Aspergillus karnatakaensis]|uniref:cytochrome P450 n=1 Tax=Aspergillus karnatakaensis TaxID=1810916 RepID=UPI003CCD85F7